MSFEYSCFISYRREEQRNKFIENFCKHLATAAFDACNKQNLFIDKKGILVGDDFPERIYNGIRSSYYFVLFHNYHYLHTDNVWCAKELKYALDVEKARIELMNDADKENYKWIIPLVIRGNLNDLPQIIPNRHGIPIGCYEAVINSHKPLPQLVLNFFTDLYEKMIVLYHIHENYPAERFDDCYKEIPYPTDEEIIEWINEQKKRISSTEAKNLPTLKKDDN